MKSKEFIGFDIDFLRDFLSELDSFNKFCLKLESDSRANLSSKRDSLAKNTATLLEKQRGLVRDDVSTKKATVQRYESGLQSSDQQDKGQLASVYSNLSRAKIAIAKGSGGSQSEVQQQSGALLATNRNQREQSRNKLWTDYQAESNVLQQHRDSKQKAADRDKSKDRKDSLAEYKLFEETILNETEKGVSNKALEFVRKFAPDKIDALYDALYRKEPFVESFTKDSYNLKAMEIPESVKIATLAYDLSSLNLGDRAKALLETYYPMLYKISGRERFVAPFSLAFDENFNFTFEIDSATRDFMVDRVRSLALRLFMLLPPNRVNFTFIDPVTLGKTFDLFGNVVDDQTRKVINGKAWSTQEEIDDRLQTLTEHIANVTQRYLKGNYKTIHKYNADAGKNAEPYQVLVVMDFPANFKEESLRKLEQIISTGPECGVYTIIVKNNDQLPKDENRKIAPLISNIEAKTSRFKLVRSGRGDAQMVVSTVKGANTDGYNGVPIELSINEVLQGEVRAKVLQTIKEGIKEADRITINFDEEQDFLPDVDKWHVEDSREGLKIPIGIHGAKDIQSIEFGERAGAHHALITGQIGSGKSSLLHTIIMSALIRYSPEELQVYLVDFKRGVEFKIYANYLLPTFRAVVIESEREFGHSLVAYLDREISRRAELFRSENVDDVQGYRNKTNKKLPRILLIIDEFHVLFSRDNDKTTKDSAAHLEQLIRQGRAFGMHVILASQTIANVGGVGQEVWGQVGVRIALKCTKDDARFILGPDNDGVDLLSPTDPGQAVYNSEAGNPIKNTIFRVVYLEQKRQETILPDIAKKLKDDAKGKYPDTRVMLSNVDDNIYHPFQKFADSERFGKERVAFEHNEVLIGEPLEVVNNMKVLFKDRDDEDPTANMLIVGNDEQKARSMFAFSALSLILGALSKNNYKKPTDSHRIYIVDFAPDDYPQDDALVLLAKMLPDYVKYVDFEKSKGLVKAFYEEMMTRKPGSGEHDKKYLFLFGLQRARDLRSNSPYQTGMSAGDDFDLPTAQMQSATPYDMFTSIVRGRTDSHVHTVAWVDSFKTFMLHYGALLANFNLRIGFTMPDDDSLQFIEEPNGSQISENSAIFSYNRNQKFRPYKKPTLDWLEIICKRISEFN